MLKTLLRMVALAVPVTMVFAQQDRGTFNGTVSDPSGAAIPGVMVTIVNIATNARYDSVTNDAGQYTVPNLPIGTYKLTYQRSGFKSYVRETTTLNVAQVVRVDVQMQVGAITESIEVRDDVPMLQSDSPEVGTVINSHNVNDLPLGFAGGRYAENFAYKLAPGVSGNNWESRINGTPPSRRR